MAIAYTVTGLGICQEDMGPIPEITLVNLIVFDPAEGAPLSFESRTQYPPLQPVRLLERGYDTGRLYVENMHISAFPSEPLCWMAFLITT